MDVHEIVDYVALDVVLHSVHHAMHTHIEHFDVGQVLWGAREVGVRGQSPPRGWPKQEQGQFRDWRLGLILLFHICSSKTILHTCPFHSVFQETDFSWLPSLVSLVLLTRAGWKVVSARDWVIYSHASLYTVVVLWPCLSSNHGYKLLSTAPFPWLQIFPLSYKCSLPRSCHSWDGNGFWWM